MKKYIVAGLVVLAGCGGGGGSGTPAAADTSTSDVSSPSDTNTQVVALAMTGGATSASSQGTSDLGNNTGKSVDDTAPELSLNQIFTNILANKINKDSAPSTEASKSILIDSTSSTRKVTFQNESVSMGGGLVTFNGPVSLQATSNTAISLNGNVSADFQNVTVIEIVRNTQYTEVINGTVDLGFNGTFTAQLNNLNQVTAINSGLTISFTGSNIKMAGTVTGTVNSLSLSASTSGNALNASSLSTTCSGSITASSENKTLTCNITSNCNGCL